MKTKIKTGIALAAFLGAGALASHADILASDDFSYADGALSGQNGGTGFSTAWGAANGNTEDPDNIINVASGVVVASGTDHNQIFRGLDTAFGNSGSVWAQFDYMTTVDSYSGIQFFNGTTEQALIGGRGDLVWTLSGGTGDYVASTVAANDTMKTGVIEFDIDSGTLNLWVVDQGSTVNVSTTAADVTKSGFTLAGIDTIRIGSRYAQTIDNFEYAETAVDLTSAIPEPATMGLVGAFGVSILFIRRIMQI